ncbi:MAG TPA: DUF423 domain-containing protein [Pirellulales bacterium]|jgi:uncharacterized membrane protein YgdD (TMEM256/DUF423 family)
MSPKVWLVCGALSGALGVGLGAYHAHGLEKLLAQRTLPADELSRQMNNFDVGVRYEIYHALALISVGLLALRARSTWFNVAGGLFLAGTVLFCGCLYIPALTASKLPWFLVPSGGLALIVGWVLVALGALMVRTGE